MTSRPLTGQDNENEVGHERANLNPEDAAVCSDAGLLLDLLPGVVVFVATVSLSLDRSPALSRWPLRLNVG